MTTAMEAVKIQNEALYSEAMDIAKRISDLKSNGYDVIHQELRRIDAKMLRYVIAALTQLSDEKLGNLEVELNSMREKVSIEMDNLGALNEVLRITALAGEHEPWYIFTDRLLDKEIAENPKAPTGIALEF